MKEAFPKMSCSAFFFSAKRSSPTNNQSVSCESPNLDSGRTEVSSVLGFDKLQGAEGEGNKY